MVEKLIQKLQVKPVPEPPRPVIFKIGQMNTLNIADNRDQANVNRDEIMERVKAFRKVKNIENEKDKEDKGEIPKDKIKLVRKIKKLKIIDPKGEEGEIKVKSKKIKKIKGKKLISAKRY